MRLTALMLVACGVAPAVAPVEILPPNIEDACARTEECGVFVPEQRQACAACLEHVDPEARAWIDQQELPPLEEVDCDTLQLVVEQYTNLAKCVSARWYGP